MQIQVLPSAIVHIDGTMSPVIIYICLMTLQSKQRLLKIALESMAKLK